MSVGRIGFVIQWGARSDSATSITEDPRKEDHAAEHRRDDNEDVD